MSIYTKKKQMLAPGEGCYCLVGVYKSRVVDLVASQNGHRLSCCPKKKKKKKKKKKNPKKKKKKKKKKKRQKTTSWPVIIVATDLIPILWHVVTAGGSDITIQMAEDLGTYICIYERPQHGRLDHLLKPKSARLLCRRFRLHGETGVHWVSSIKHWTGPVKEAVSLETKNNNSSELNISQGACTSMMSRSVSQQSCCGCQPSRGDVKHCCLFFFFS